MEPVGPPDRFPCWPPPPPHFPRGVARWRDPSSLNFPDPGAPSRSGRCSRLRLPSAKCDASFTCVPGCPFTSSSLPFPGLPSPFAPVASWKQVFAPVVLELPKAAALQRFLPCAEFGAAWGSRASVGPGRLSRAEPPSLPPCLLSGTMTVQDSGFCFCFFPG